MQRSAASARTPRGERSADANRGQEQRFDDLYEECFGPLVHLCRRFLGPHRDAEAVAQEALLRAWASFGTFAQDRPFWPWVATIARRLCINEVTGSTRREELLVAALPRLSPTPTSHEEAVEQRADLHEVRRALSRLPRRQQRLLHLRDVEGWSYDEIARFDGVSTESVRGSLKRARAAFRRTYERIGTGVLGGLLPGLRRAFRAGEHASAGLAGKWAGVDRLALAVSALLLAAVPSQTLPERHEPLPQGQALEQAAEPVPQAPPVPRLTGRPRVAPAASAIAEGPAASVEASSPAQPPGEFRTLGGSSFSFTPSPAYEDDRTVFAYGDTGCATPTAGGCWGLFKSSDGGATWTRLPAANVGVGGGRLLLPPAFPRDPRMFVTGAQFVWVSEDGGHSFDRLIPNTGTVALSPLFSMGDPRMLLGASPLQLGPGAEYDVEREELRPSNLPLPPTATPFAYAFAPSYAKDRRVIVSAVELAPDSLRGIPKVSTAYSCSPTACQRVLVVPGSPLPPSITSAAADPEVLYSWTGSSLHRSLDGGASFQEAAIPGRADARHLLETAIGSDGRVFATIWDGDGDTTYNLYVSGDRAATWELVARGLARLSGLTVLPDGTMLASRSSLDGGGVVCSVDGGRSWATSCPARTAA